MARQITLVEAPPKAGELLERSSEFATLEESLNTVERTARGRIVLVGGEAGVGKTTLLRRFCEESGPAARVLWGDCDSLFTPRPLGPLLAVAESTRGELGEIVASEARPHEVVAALARELSARARTVFVLEDVHWADEATLDVLRLLARRIETIPALIFASYRDDELHGSHPLRIVLGELTTGDSVQRLKVGAFSPEAVSQLAQPYGVDDEELYLKTQGNPFFVVEALAAGGDAIPDTVRDAILARAARLTPGARRLLEAVAVVPPQAEFWLLESVAGKEIDQLDECLSSGMLVPAPTGVAFRHELARLAVEESIAPHRAIELNRKALAALTDPPTGTSDLARIAHHAEKAGHADAVLRFAPAAAARASSLGAHREAVAQYARALRFGDALSPDARAELLERRSRACFLTDQYDEGIAALEEAVVLRRALGDKLKEGDDLCRLSEFFWCPGRIAEADRSAREGVALLESLPISRELGAAYLNLTFLSACAGRVAEASAWARRALRLGEQFDDTELVLKATSRIAECEGDEAAVAEVHARAMEEQRVEFAGDMFIGRAWQAIEARRHAAAARHLETGIAYCGERGLELFRLYLLASRARLELDQGRWSESADTAESVLRIPRTSTTPRIFSLVVLGLIRARRGDPGHREALDEAWRLAEPTGELPRLAPVALARAEAAWLERDDATASRRQTRHSRARSSCQRRGGSASSRFGDAAQD